MDGHALDSARSRKNAARPCLNCGIPLGKHAGDCLPQGTAWTAPGQGATVGDLENALFDEAILGDYAPDTYDRRQNIYRKIKIRNPLRKTNLRLTGSPLTAADLENIAKCEVAK